MYDWDKDGVIDAEDDATTLMVMDDDGIPGHKKKRAKGCSCGCASPLLLLAIIVGLILIWLR
jgi:hypothetical protein